MGVYTRWECKVCRQWRRTQGVCCGFPRANRGTYLEYYVAGERKTEKVQSKARGLYLLSKRMDQPSVDKRLAVDLFSEWVKGRSNQRVEERLWIPVGRFLGKRKISEVNHDLVMAYIKHRRGEGVKESSILREIGVLRPLVVMAKGDMDAFKRLGVRLPDTRVDKYLSAQEWKHLCANLPHGIVPFVTFLYETACRRREAMTLTWKSVDIERGLVWVHGKTGNGGLQVVHLSPAAKAILLSLPKDGELVFSLDRDPSRSLRAHAESCGLNDTLRSTGRAPITGTHFFRHAAISRWVQAGIDLMIVSRMARHASYDQTLQYAHLRPQDIAETLAKLTPLNG